MFRHPDHHPSGHELQEDLAAGFKDMSLRAFDLSKFSQDALKSLYGTSDDVVLFWAHHEKLCLIDDQIAFMGGLDMCKPLSKLVILSSLGTSPLIDS